MSKGGIIVLIVAALVFCGLGFVIGQVVQAADTNPGTKDDPYVQQSYVEKLVANHVSDLQQEIDSLKAQLEGADISVPTDVPDVPDVPSTPGTTSSTVTVTSDSVNVRASASTSADIVGTANNGDVLTYLGSTTASDGTWYNVRLSNGTSGYIASWLCGNPT